MSIFPGVRGRDLINYNLGGSGIFAVTRDFNLMLEMVAGWNEEVDFAVKTARATVNRTTTALISPGFRYAFATRSLSWRLFDQARHFPAGSLRTAREGDRPLSRRRQCHPASRSQVRVIDFWR
jgi:hypothetical protein